MMVLTSEYAHRLMGVPVRQLEETNGRKKNNGCNYGQWWQQRGSYRSNRRVGADRAGWPPMVWRRRRQIANPGPNRYQRQSTREPRNPATGPTQASRGNGKTVFRNRKASPSDVFI